MKLKPIIIEENIDPTEWDKQLAYLKDKTGLSINNCINYKENSGLMQILRDSSTAINIILVDTEAEIIEGDLFYANNNKVHKYLGVEELDPDQNRVDKIISSTNKFHKSHRLHKCIHTPSGKYWEDEPVEMESMGLVSLPQLSPQSIQMLINYYNEHKCMPESVDVEKEEYHGWNKTIAEVAAVSANNNGEDYQTEFDKVLEKQGGKEYRMLINQQGEVSITIPEEEIIGKPMEDYVRAKRTQEECVGFIDGWNAAKEKLYTEEEVEKLFKDASNHCYAVNQISEWFNSKKET